MAPACIFSFSITRCSLRSSCLGACRDHRGSAAVHGQRKPAFERLFSKFTFCILKMPPMDERVTADDLKLSVKVLSDSCFRETTMRPGLDDEDEPIKDIQLWNRKRCLSRSDANNVFLYDSQAGAMRVVKHVRWQDNEANYERELNVMKRVLRGVK